MTPNDIDVLLHYYCSPKEHDRFEAPAVKQAISMFYVDGIFDVASKEAKAKYGGSYQITDKGRVLVEMLCNTPFPIPSWRDPRE